MNKLKKCRKCSSELYRDDQEKWFCPNCILEQISSEFMDESQDYRGGLKRPYVLESPTKQVSIRLPVSDLELARKLARRKRVPKYQTYIKQLLHDALRKEESSGR